MMNGALNDEHKAIVSSDPPTLGCTPAVTELLVTGVHHKVALLESDFVLEFRYWFKTTLIIAHQYVILQILGFAEDLEREQEEEYRRRYLKLEKKTKEAVELVKQAEMASCVDNVYWRFYSAGARQNLGSVRRRF